MKFRLSWLIVLVWGIFNAQQTKEINLKRYEVAMVSDTLQELSGLTMLHHQLFAMNDSGNPADIFQMNPRNGTIVKTYRTNAQNVDWESITNDGKDFYVGDFGNNLGDRKDLTIYKIGYDSLQNLLKVQKSLPFYYPEQNDFTPANLNTDYDGEAMIYLHNRIHIFTKEWKSMKVTHYTINPLSSGLQSAKLMGEYPTGFAVTDASYLKGKLYLVGYTKMAEIYLMVFNETSPGIFFASKPQKFYLGMATGLGQIEGITATSQGLYISGERFHVAIFDTNSHLYFLPYRALK